MPKDQLCINFGESENLLLKFSNHEYMQREVIHQVGSFQQGPICIPCQVTHCFDVHLDRFYEEGFLLKFQRLL